MSEGGARLVAGCRHRAAGLLLTLIVAAACHRTEPAAPTAPPLGVDQRGVIDPRRIAFHPTDPNRLLVAERGGDVAVWDIVNPSQPIKRWSMQAHATDAQFLPDGTTIVTSGGDGRVHGWGATADELWRSSEPHGGAIRAIAVGPDRIASAGEDGVIRLWDLDGTPKGALRGHQGLVLSVAFSPTGDWLASEGADTRLRLWMRGVDGNYAPAAEFRDPEPRYQRMLPNLVKWDVQWGWDRSVAFSPSGTALAATGLDGAAQLWSLDGTPRGAPMTDPAHHHVRSIAFSPDGTLIAVGSLGGTIQIWNVDGTPHGAPLHHHTDAIASLTFNRTGNRLASASVDGSVLLWNPADGHLDAALPRGIGSRASDPVNQVMR